MVLGRIAHTPLQATVAPAAHIWLVEAHHMGVARVHLTARQAQALGVSSTLAQVLPLIISIIILLPR